MEQSEKTLDMIVNLCKNRGYVPPVLRSMAVLPTAGTTVPCVEFKNNVKKVEEVCPGEPTMGLDAAIIMKP